MHQNIPQPRPLDVTFEGKFPDETVYYVFEKHWISELPELLTLIFFYIVPTIAAIVISFLVEMRYIPLVWLLASFYLIITGLLLLIRWLNEALDLFVLTDKRLIDITQRGFLSRQTTAANLSQIQHVTYKQRGVVDTVLNLGYVDVLTAGSNPDMALEYIENPAQVADIILDFAVEKTKIHQ
ncbi:MAG: PH domain-containing protein [Candidatus Gracilibacteria bacterium]